VDLNTRQLRYFVTVAEELHFTRAAARLFIAQQSLSARIRELEEAVGVTLLRRTTRSVELTPAGELFLEEARRSLAALDRAIDGARAVQQSAASVLSIGFMVSAAAELTAPILTEFARRYPQVRVDLHEYPYEDPSVGLASSAVDVGFVRLPITLPEGRFERLFVDPRGVCVSTEHPLASRESVSVSEVLDEPLSAPLCADPAWRAYWTLEAQRGGRPAPAVVAETGSLAEELDAVALGQYVMITVATASRYAPRPGVRIVPIHDIPGSETAVGWRADRETDVVRAFVNTARDVRDRETDLIASIERGEQP
jgi:DNA-binding transcriptional LysR family regulator